MTDFKHISEAVDLMVMAAILAFLKRRAEYLISERNENLAEAYRAVIVDVEGS